MSYIGDLVLGQTVDTKFCTVQATGAPTTLSGSPVISAYVGNGTTEITAGITLTVDFDSRTGLNNVRTVASNGNGFAVQTDVQLVITTGTVNSVSAVGYVVSEFSIQNRFTNVAQWNGLATVALPLVPTTAGRTLDVSATGEAGLDWANVGSPTTTLALTGTTIAVTQKVDIDTIKTNPVVNAGTITFPTTATLASTTNITGGTITTTTNLTNAPTSGDFTATMKTSIGTAVAASAVASVTGNVGGNVTGSVASVVAAVSITGDLSATMKTSVTTAATAATPTINSASVVASVTGAVGSVTGAVGSVTGAVGSVTATVNADVKKINAATVQGTGVSGDLWRG